MKQEEKIEIGDEVLIYDDFRCIKTRGIVKEETQTKVMVKEDGYIFPRYNWFSKDHCEKITK